MNYNEILSILIDKLTCLQYLTFGYWFNQSSSNIVNKLIIHNLDEILSIPIDKLTCLQHLTFGYWFNQPLSNSLDKLTSLQCLTFGYSFNQLPIKFCKNFMELQKINLCLFSWETIIQ